MFSSHALFYSPFQCQLCGVVRAGNMAKVQEELVVSKSAIYYENGAYRRFLCYLTINDFNVEIFESRLRVPDHASLSIFIEIDKLSFLEWIDHFGGKIGREGQVQERKRTALSLLAFAHECNNYAARHLLELRG